MRHLKVYESDNERNISIWLVFIITILVISIISLFLYLKGNTVQTVHYDETSDLDYNVLLKENDYFEANSLHKDNQYIASLIDYINANFKYNLKFEENLHYNYKYKIVANVNVIDNNTNRPIYTFSEDLLNEVTGESNNILDINESIMIDYNKYNDKISQFVKTYNLSNITSKLTLNMHLGIDGDVDELDKENNSVISLDIPLTTNTVAIDVNYDLANNTDNLITLKSGNENNKIWLNLAIAIFVVDLGVVGFFIKYLICFFLTSFV